MHDMIPGLAAPKITEQERYLADMIGNLADAQVYLPLTEAQNAALPGLDLISAPRGSLDMTQEKAAFLNAFAHFHGGLSLPGPQEVLFGYSASMGIEILANALRLSGQRRVGLMYPTYDATYHILTRHGARLTPIAEAQLEGPRAALEALFAPLDAVMLTLPNNPTGWGPDAAAFARIAQVAVSCGTCLIVDACFRAYDGRRIDHYRILRSAGVPFIVIEDTGKLFAIKDLKLGLMIVQGPLAPLVWDIHRDYLLDVPLFPLVTLRRLLETDGPAHGARLRGAVARNRTRAAVALRPLGLVPIGKELSNVQLFRLPPGLKADAVQARAFREGVGVVAANAYFWGDQAAPGEFIRLALARTAAEFDRQISQLAEVLARVTPRFTKRLSQVSCHQKLTEIDGLSDRVLCHHQAGTKRMSPGSSTTRNRRA